MLKAAFFILIFCFNRVTVAWSQDSTNSYQQVCAEKIAGPKANDVLAELKNQLADPSAFFQECAEVEMLDPLLEPFRVQSLALKLCSENPVCVSYLIQQAAFVSGLPEEKFTNKPLVQLWGEILQQSARNRKPPPTIDSFPIAKSQNEIFALIQQETEVKRQQTKADQQKWACTGLAMIVGPGKVKGLQVVAGASKLTTTVMRTKDVEKIIKNNRVPQEVIKKFETWEKSVAEKGLEEVKKIPGFHHEPVKSKPGTFSVRLNQGYRLFYEEVVENGVKKIKALDINMHDYK